MAKKIENPSDNQCLLLLIETFDELKKAYSKKKTLSFLQLVTKPLYSRSKFSSKHQRCGGKTNVVMYGTAKQEKSILGYIYCCMYGSAHKKSLAKLFCHSLFIKLLKCAAKMLDCLPVTEGMMSFITEMK